MHTHGMLEFYCFSASHFYYTNVLFRQSQSGRSMMSSSFTVPNQDNRNGRYGYQIMAAARSVRVETCCFLLIYQLTIE